MLITASMALPLRYVTKFILIAMTGALASPMAHAGNRCSALFESADRALPIRTFEASETLSQMVRDNAPDYWKFSQKNGAEYFGKFSEVHGLVVGDTHPGNFIIAPLNGKLEFFIADIKDSGDAPLIYDFARLVLSTHAILKGEVKLADSALQLQKAYEAGLLGEHFGTPRDIQSIFKHTMKEYSELQSEYVEGKLREGRLKKKAGVLEEIPFKTRDPQRFDKLKRDIRKYVREAMGSEAEVLDFAFRPRERGGSVDMNRYWALVKDKNNLSILEFKQVSTPATSQIRAQEDAFSRYERIIDTFWQKRDPLYKTVSLDGDVYFMRPKKTDLFRVPYRLDWLTDIDFTLALARYDAFYLGQLHGRQQKTKDYATLVRAKRTELNTILRDYTKDYIYHLQDRIDEANSEY